MSEDELRKTRLLAMEVLTGMEPMLDGLDGMVAAAVRRGFTEDQARAIVAYMFGHRPVDGTKPDGVQG